MSLAIILDRLGGNDVEVQMTAAIWLCNVVNQPESFWLCKAVKLFI